jgi:hypothetical protein
VQLAASRAKLDVVATVMVRPSLGKHGVILNLRLAHGGAVVGDDDELGLRAEMQNISKK